MDTVITLTTDFGLADAYVATMKGVILEINPRAAIVDICHTIKPQAIMQAGFILSTTYRYFPTSTIHTVVVDPGVGTDRKAVILQTPRGYFIAPDNGVLSFILEDLAESPVNNNQSLLYNPPPNLKAYNITNPDFWIKPTSNTFHGRDIFAPVAAYLSLGKPVEDFGERIKALTLLPVPHASHTAEGAVTGSIIHIDHFGNLITSIRGKDITPLGKDTLVEIGSHTIRGLSRTYTEGTGLIAIIGSSDRLEISMANGDASQFTGAMIDDPVTAKQ